MSKCFYYIVCIFAIIWVIAFASLRFFCERFDRLARVTLEQMTDEEYIKHFGPAISEFLGLNFPGQYAPTHYMYVFGNIRTTSYDLTEEDREQAIKKLQEMFQNTQKVSVAFYTDAGHTYQLVKEELLSYDQYLITTLCEQADLIQQTHIPTLTTSWSGPAIVFTLHPSGVRFNIIPRVDGIRCYVTLRHKDPSLEYAQRWQGDFHYLTLALLDAHLQDGETVRSVASRILDYYSWYPKESFFENGNSTDQADSE